MLAGQLNKAKATHQLHPQTNNPISLPIRGGKEMELVGGLEWMECSLVWSFWAVAGYGRCSANGSAKESEQRQTNQTEWNEWKQPKQREWMELIDLSWLRSWIDEINEVEQAMDQLMEWTEPTGAQRPAEWPSEAN